MPVPHPPTAAVPPPAALVLPAFAVPSVVACRPKLAITLAPTKPASAVLWVRHGPPAAIVSALLTELGPQAADGFELMAVGGPVRLTLVRAARPGASPLWSRGFTVSAVPSLYLPVGRRLVPATPPWLSPRNGWLIWLSDDPEPVLNSARVAFRPFADWWAATAPPVKRLASVAVPSPFGVSEPHLPRPETPPPARPSVSRPAPRPEPRRPLRTRLPRIAAALVPTAAARPPAVHPDILALECRLVTETTTRTPVEHAALWAELAAGYRAAGRRADEAVCWLNAVWCHPAPPAHWPRPWLEAEAATADVREAGIPVRAAWLTRHAQYDHDGDSLALVRCRDRLYTRMAGGSEPDLDVPSFLRRADRGVDPDAVRAWLVAVADPVRKWLAGCGPATKLTWAGLDADRAATRRYAELILAWGTATVGDRSALDRANEAVTALHSLRRQSGTDPTVHRILGDRFMGRVRAALTGQPEPRPTSDAAAPLSPICRYAVERLQTGCESLGRHGEPPFDTPAGQVITSAEAARAGHQPDGLRALFDTLDPTTALDAAGRLFRAARSLGLAADAAGLIASLAALRPTPGGRRDLGLAVGRYLIGDEAGGDRSLDAARHRLFVTGVPDLRKRGELAVAYATAVGHAAPGLVLGRLDELFRRLGPVSAQGACGRYFALLPLRVVDAAVRAAVGDDFAPSAAVRRWLADEELTTRRRIARDIKQVLRAEW